MKRLSGLSLAVILAVGMVSLSMTSFAQQKVAKSQFIGTFRLVSCANASGGKPPFCADPNGLAVLQANGRIIVIIAARGRPKFTGSGNRTQQSAEDYKAAAQGLVADFGTWSFNEADQIFTFHRDASLFPNIEGTDGTFSVAFSGEEMSMVASNGGVFVWRRAE